MNLKILAGVLIAAAIAVGGWFYLSSKENPQPSTTNTPESLPELAAETKVKEVLAVEEEEDFQEQTDSLVAAPASVRGSDEVVREAVSDLSPSLTDYLGPDQQLRKWIVVVDQLAGYKWPTKNLPLLYPKADFKVLNTSNGMVSSPENSKRWDKLIGLVSNLDAKRVAIYYKNWSPLIEGTYKELGNPNSFDFQLRDAIDHLLFIKPLPAQAQLHRPKVFYEYVDPALENADPLSKWMWRLGPDNMAKLQAWLRELKAYL
ncbi:DUF3014 domain-containing protein [Spongiibacter sp. KMU-158]|uniref:DUF3014 domain-containing protein n=1 Tax=Spongiibacter pelagi TaxID=2760804 RepID=A0A927C2N8_9GAMM|nr:DUF3014 domain-containing protein [Spongiibacter pelagi]MBD2858370.1 DUF3014 domain-containing protein [Spongiibacter pelagi]